MNTIVYDTLKQYEKLFELPMGNRDDYYRYEIMKPFEKLWQAIHVPLKADMAGGYDVVTFSKMNGFLDLNQDTLAETAISILKKEDVIKKTKKVLTECINFSHQFNLKVNSEDIKLGFFLADPEKLKLQKGYTGFGGIPGYIQICIYPNKYNLERIPAVIAHEFHHNIRFSYFNWDHMNVSVGDYLVIEGLAEAFAKELYGEKLLGPWVTSITQDELNSSINIINDALEVKGFEKVGSYIFGDEIAEKQGFQPMGLPPFAGYAVGYQAVQSFMKNNNVSILEATLLKSEEILENCGIWKK
ncbi:DUF2268 domain-containing protein [Chengkuizengella sediminis]|uniref:DUF2268 domain-containing protein n=1 Tax=Chengkuizengella sediminis TaxID=1885917 RepID=UPI00138A1DF0|nr:DUF2268 domain-containing putative Zn-dependent protease [Chengkuizengella sediminis]NDI35345.1 hypothetical protein [Chengkuizengella sediminis]